MQQPLFLQVAGQELEGEEYQGHVETDNEK